MLDDAPHDHSLMQDPAFAAALRSCGQKPVLLPGGLMALYRRVFGVPVAMLPRAHPPPDLPDQLRTVGLDRVPLILSPETAHARPSGAIRLTGPRSCAVVDLKGPDSAARAALHPKWRNQLVRAERAALTVDLSPLPADPRHPLLLMEAAQSRNRGYANWPAALTAAFAAAAPAQTCLFTARRGGKPVAHMLFLQHGARATYHIGHISAAGKSVCAHNLLMWRAIRHFSDAGLQRLDLGVLDPRTPSLSRFKLRAGVMAAPTGGTWLRWNPVARPLHALGVRGLVSRNKNTA